MSDAPGSPESSNTPSSPPPSSPPPPSQSAGVSGKELEEGKLFAILGYVLNIFGLPFWIAPLVMRNNEFALYHAKQAAFLWIAGVLLGIGGVVIFLVVAMVLGPLACLVQVAIGLLGLGMVILNVLGLVNAITAKAVPLPLVGGMALNMFKSVTMKA